MKREASVAGAFYPHDKDEILSTFAYFDEVALEHFSNVDYDEDVKALIVPHAGYVYSGFSANLAYKNAKKTPKTVVVIGPSHRVAFTGVSLVEYDSYETPLGDIEADKEYMKYLLAHFDFISLPQAHHEHSTEVQFPFIKHYFKDAKLVELVYGRDAKLDAIIENVLKKEDTLLLISTDLSHFYNQKEANQLDTNCIRAVENLDVDFLNNGEACGKEGVKALINVVKKLDLKTKSIDYRTSGDITKDLESVVGYYSAIVY